jgi:hypothetical protein
MNMFHEKFKYKDSKTWNGTEKENLTADTRIATAIKSSLKHYEKNPQNAGFKGSFFKF